MNWKSIGRTAMLLGALGLLLGTGPLVVVAIVAPNSNPIGYGILAYLTFLPSLGLVIGGWMAWMQGARKQGHRHELDGAAGGRWTRA